MSAVPWPGGPFYIMLKLWQGNALEMIDEPGPEQGVGPYVVQGLITKPVSGDPSQLWTAVPDPLEGGSIITNVKYPLVLTAINIQPDGTGAPSTIVAAHAASPSTPYQSWVLDDEPTDGWNRVQSLPTDQNWWMQYYHDKATVIVAGYQNDWAVWRIIPETGSLALSGLSYQLANAVASLNVQPVSFLAVEVDNTSGTAAVTQTITLDGSIQETTEFDTSTSDTTAQTLTAAVAVEDQVIPDIVKVTETGTAQQTTSDTATWAHNTLRTQTLDHNLQTEVTVPAGKKYSYQQLLNYGTVQVPYTATGTLHSCIPGLAPLMVTLSGNFSGVNATHSTITVADVTPALPGSTGSAAVKAQVLHSVDVSLFTKAAVKIQAPQ